MPAPHPLASLAAGGAEGRALASAKLRALLETHGTVRATAVALGVHETTVADWMTAWGLRGGKKKKKSAAKKKRLDDSSDSS